MKKFYLAFSVLAAFVMTNYGYAQGSYMADSSIDASTSDMSYNVQDYGSAQPYSEPANYVSGDAGNECCPPERPCGDCYCLYCKYEPCYYNTYRCEYECYPCYKKCCRYVPQYYQKQCCRYVPQYYCVTCCRQCPQYYTTCEYKYRPKYCCERKCRYVPKYYYKHICNQNACAAQDVAPSYSAAPASSGCPSGQCGAL